MKLYLNGFQQKSKSHPHSATKLLEEYINQKEHNQKSLFYMLKFKYVPLFQPFGNKRFILGGKSPQSYAEIKLHEK